MTEREKLLLKLQKGAYSREDLEKLMDLIGENPQEDDEKVMRQLWQQFNSYEGLHKEESEAILNRTRSLIGKEPSEDLSRKTNRTRKLPTIRRRRLFLRNTAAAILLLALGAFFWIQIDKQRLISVRTEFGEQLEFTLPDGSVVKLNSNSLLSYRNNWGDKAPRRIELQGEAYFEVRKNPRYQQKFEVSTNDLKVEVLGTTFNVNARERMTTVFLEEGKVNLDLEELDDDIRMIPGDVVTYSRKTRLSEKKQILDEKEVPASWRNGTMEFKDSPLRDILQRLREIYGVEVSYENRTQLERRFRVSIPIESLDMAFDVLKEVTGLDLVLEGNKIIVR